jgi:hypothetical protein
MSLYIFPAREGFWSEPAIAVAVDQARDAARRIAKGNELVRERRRLKAALETIEQVIRDRCPDPFITEDNAVREIVEVLPVIGTCRLPFLAANSNTPVPNGFFVVPVPFDRNTDWREFGAKPREAPTLPVAVGEGEAGEARPAGAKSRIRDALADARSTGRPVPLGRSRHIEITKALRHFLHRDDGPPFTAQFVYSDGSLSGPITLARLTQRESPATASLTVGLNSCRHFEIDRQIDFYLLRNTEFDRQEAGQYSDQEQLAYDRARALMADYADEALEISLHHTGLEPAAIGFYRALIDVLLAGQRVSVTPTFSPGAPEGEIWS